MKRMNGLKEAKTLFFVVVFTFIYSLGVIWFLESLDPPLFTVGIPGIAQVFKGIMQEWVGLEIKDYIVGIFIFVVNVPILLLGYFGISKKFTIYSLVSVLIQTFVVGFIPRDNFGLTSGLDSFSVAIIGGIISGVGIGGALRFGASLGGMDIISQYISLKKVVSVGYVSLLINISIAILGGIIYKSSSLVAYTGIMIIITTLMVDKIHTAYQFLKVEIITTLKDDLIEEILVKLHRGVTLLDVKGGYKQQTKQMIIVAIATYELSHLKEIIYKNDPGAFVIVEPVRYIYGNFKKKTIV